LFEHVKKVLVKKKGNLWWNFADLYYLMYLDGNFTLNLIILHLQCMTWIFFF